MMMRSMARFALIAALVPIAADSAQRKSRIATDFPRSAAGAASPGEVAYLARCQYCHLEMGFGTLTLQPRTGPERALLANRTDLTVDYVTAVVRNGINNMPPITRAEVNDAELALIAGYLARPRGK